MEAGSNAMDHTGGLEKTDSNAIVEPQNLKRSPCLRCNEGWHAGARLFLCGLLLEASGLARTKGSRISPDVSDMG